MSNKKSNKKQAQAQSPLQVILGGVAVIIAVIVFAVTGIDPTGGQLSNVISQPTATTQAEARATNTPRPANTARPTTASVVATPAPISGNATPVLAIPALSSTVRQLNTVSNGYGWSKSFWRVYFTNPAQNDRDRTKWVGGVEDDIAAMIGTLTTSLDIAAFEFESRPITDAVIAAHKRGVRVRLVVDNDHALNDPSSTIAELEVAGIPIVDDARSAFMHNKFMIMDGLTVWMGSMNYQYNDMYRNNNNVLMMRSRAVADVYTKEFEEMFVDKLFGIRSPNTNTLSTTQSGVSIQVVFSPENDVLNTIVNELNQAKSSVRFLAFSFTVDEFAQALIERAQAGVSVEGVFENTGSETASSRLKTLFCAGLNVFQDGNPGVLHHKVFIIDAETVITGSFNFSANALRNNDENLVIIKDKDIAALYLQEFERVKSIGRTPGRFTC